jgi:hypothetical protein
MVLNVDGELFFSLFTSLHRFVRFCPLHFASFWMCSLDDANCTLRLGRHFNGEESFDTGPMAPTSEQPAVADSSALEGRRSGTKL